VGLVEITHIRHLGELVPNGSRFHSQIMSVCEHLAAHGLGRVNVLENDRPKD
jgi:hypothetical protein